jgi:hypothetical protein
MLCHEYRFIFVHIPKTAGQSIETYFLNLMGLSWENRSSFLLRPNHDPRCGPPALAHLRIVEYMDLGYVSPKIFNTYFKFAFVRNPWDRMVSEYKYRWLGKGIKFKDFLFNHFPQPGWNDHYIHIMPQYSFLCDNAGNIAVDFIGQYERLQSDFNEVCNNTGVLPGRLPLVNRSSDHRNKILPAGINRIAKMLFPFRNGTVATKSANYTEYYDNESKDYVAELYRQDIEIFGYRFEG